MPDAAQIERTILSFFSEFMSLGIESREEPLTYLLTSIQQFELLLFVETEFAVILPPSIFADASGMTVSHLAKDIDARSKKAVDQK